MNDIEHIRFDNVPYNYYCRYPYYDTNEIITDGSDFGEFSLAVKALSHTDSFCSALRYLLKITNCNHKHRLAFLFLGMFAGVYYSFENLPDIKQK